MQLNDAAIAAIARFPAQAQSIKNAILGRWALFPNDCVLSVEFTPPTEPAAKVQEFDRQGFNVIYVNFYSGRNISKRDDLSGNWEYSGTVQDYIANFLDPAKVEAFKASVGLYLINWESAFIDSEENCADTRSTPGEGAKKFYGIRTKGGNPRYDNVSTLSPLAGQAGQIAPRGYPDVYRTMQYLLTWPGPDSHTYTTVQTLNTFALMHFQGSQNIADGYMNDMHFGEQTVLDKIFETGIAAVSTAAFAAGAAAIVGGAAAAGSGAAAAGGTAEAATGTAIAGAAVPGATGVISTVGSILADPLAAAGAAAAAAIPTIVTDVGQMISNSPPGSNSPVPSSPTRPAQAAPSASAPASQPKAFDPWLYAGLAVLFL